MKLAYTRDSRHSTAVTGEKAARLRLMLLLAASSLTVMAGALVAPALPGILAAYSDVSGAPLLVRLILTVPALAIALSAPAAGLALDRFGRRWVLVAGLAAYASFGTIAAGLDSLPAILMSRVGLGIAVAMVMTSASTLLTDEFTGSRRARVMSFQGAAMGLGSFVFLLAGGQLSALSWRAPFFVYLVAVLLIPPTLMLVKRDRGASTPGSSSETTSFPWVGLLPLFSAGLLGMLLFYLIPTQLPFLLSEGLGRTGFDIGLAVGGATLVTSLSSLLSPFAIARLGRPRVLGAGFASMALGLALLSEADTYGRVLSATVCFGSGGGLLMPTLAAWVGDLAPLEQRGRAIGLLTTSYFLGQFLSPLAAGPVLSLRGLQGAGGVFSSGAVLAAVAGVLAIVAARRRSPITAAETDTRSPGSGSA